MKKSLLLLLLAACASQVTANTELKEWQQQAQNVTIIRDDWGIAHVYGKTARGVLWGLGNRESGIGNRWDPGIGNGESGIGNRCGA